MPWPFGGRFMRRAIVSHEVIVGLKLIADFSLNCPDHSGDYRSTNQQLQAMREDLSSGQIDCG